MARRAVGLIGPGRGPLIAAGCECRAVVKGMGDDEHVVILVDNVGVMHRQNGVLELGTCNFVQFHYEGTQAGALFSVEA